MRIAIYMYRIILLYELPFLGINHILNPATHDYQTRISSNLVFPFPRKVVIEMNFRYQLLLSGIRFRRIIFIIKAFVYLFSLL